MFNWIKSQVSKSHFWQLPFLSAWTIVLNGILLYWFAAYYGITSFINFKSHILSLFEGSYLLQDIEKNFFHLSTFESARRNLLILFLLFLILNCSVFYLIKRASSLLHDIKDQRAASFNSKEKVYIFLFFLFWLAYKIFLINQLPIHIDEVFDYHFFAKCNILTRHTYQFFEGNHWINTQVFYTDLCSIFYKMGLPSKYAMRLPSIIGELWLLLFIIKRTKFSSIMHLLLLLFAIVISFWTSIYSVEARSYYLMGVCAFCSYIYLNEMCSQPSKGQFYSLLLLSIVGFALCKLYFVPFLGLIIYFILNYSKTNNYSWFIPLCLLISILTILFYFPVILVGGTKCIYASSKRGFLSELSLYPAFFEIISFITNIDKKAYLIFFLLPLIYFLKNTLKEETKHIYVYLLAQFISMLLSTLLLGAYLPSRLFVYLNIAFSLFIILLVFDVSEKTKWSKTLPILVCSLLTLNTFYNFKYGWANNDNSYILGKKYYSQIDECLDKIEKLNPKSIFIPIDEHSLGFYALDRFENKLKVNMSNNYSGEEMYVSSSNFPLKNYSKICTIDELELNVFFKKQN